MVSLQNELIKHMITEKRIYIVVLLALLLAASCETPISMELPEEAGTTVIEGWIENGKTATVAISRSLSYYSGLSLDTVFAAIDTAATVIVTDDMGNAETLRLGVSWEHIFGMMGRVYVGKTMRGVPGHAYNLYVKTANGNEYTAQTRIPERTVHIDSIRFRINNPAADTLLPVHLYLRDDPDAYDCYRFFINISNLKLQYPLFLYGLKYYYSPASGGCFDDLTFNGQPIGIELVRTAAGNLSFSDMSREERREYYRALFKPGDVVCIRSALTDVSTYKYWFALQLDMESGGMNPMVVPGHYKTNLVGKDVTGIWSGYHARYDTIVFPGF